MLASALSDIPATILVLQRQLRAGELEILEIGLGREVHDLSDANDDLEDMLHKLSLYLFGLSYKSFFP